MGEKKRKKLPIIIGAAVAVIAIIVILVIALGGHRVIKVKSFVGTVALERGFGEKDIVKGMNLKSNDKITTGNDGMVQLLVDDDKNILAQENTCFQIVASGNEKKGKLKIKLEYGTSLIEIENKLPDGSEVELETPNAALSVRGTTFETTYNEGEATTVVKVTDGVVNVASDTKEMEVPAGNMATVKDDEIKIEPLPIEYRDVEAFEVRYSSTKEYSGIHAKELVEWTTNRKMQDSNEPDGFLRNGICIRYWAYTEAEMNLDVEEYGNYGYLQNLSYLKNGDGETITSLAVDFKGEMGGINKAYCYYKKISDDFYLSIMVYDEAGGELLEGTDINTYLPLTNHCYYAYSFPVEVYEGESATEE